MCHHGEPVDHDRVVELAAEWERWQREQGNGDADAEATPEDGMVDTEERPATSADD